MKSRSLLQKRPEYRRNNEQKRTLYKDSICIKNRSNISTDSIGDTFLISQIQMSQWDKTLSFKETRAVVFEDKRDTKAVFAEELHE